MPIEAMIPSDFDPDYQTPDAPLAGKYHTVIIRVEEDGGKQGEMIVDYEVLAGNVKDQEGKVFRDWFHKTAKAMARMHQLAMACGMITSEQLKDMRDRGQSPTYDFEGQAMDKHICLDLYADEYPKGSGIHKTKCGFGIYSIHDPKVAKSPWVLNHGYLAKAGITVQKSDKPTAPPAPSQKATAAAGSAVDGLLDGVV